MKILGISAYYHDSAAALVIDGKVVAASQEERFSRKKHDSDFPTKSINFCLKESSIKAKDLDYVVFYEKPFTKFERITMSMLQTAPKARGSFVDAYRSTLKSKLWIKSTIKKELKIDSEKILFVPHHLSHAASAYYSSDFSESVILTIDGVGEWTTTAIGYAKDNKIYLDKEIKFPHSLGLLYSTFTQYLGFRINNGEFKVMGLSPYGKPVYRDKIEKMIIQNPDGSFKLELKYFNYQYSDKVAYSKEFIKLLGKPPADPKSSDNVYEEYADIAASIQVVLEEKIIKIANYLYDKYKINNLSYSGGVALNGVVNWKILKETKFDDLYIHPAAGDSGGALGAAYYVYYHVLDNAKQNDAFSTAYLGYENTNVDIEKFIKRKKLKAIRMSDNKLTEYAAKQIADKKVIGWVQGRSEWGPRALGNRSILADPRSIAMKDLVNSKIKFRESFRPFAPVVIEEESDKYFDVGKHSDSPIHKYMISVVKVNKKYQKNLGAITHINGSARPQFIKRDDNKLYYDVVKKFGKITKIPVVLNTSFNLKGEPIVNNAEDAYKTFMASGIDILVLGNWIIEK